MNSLLYSNRIGDSLDFFSLTFYFFSMFFSELESFVGLTLNSLNKPMRTKSCGSLNFLNKQTVLVNQ